MSANRFKGRDATIRLTQDGVPLREMTAISDFTVQVDQRILEENFLGRTSIDKDEIFDGVSGTINLQPESPQALEFQLAMKNRSKGQLANTTKVNLSGRIAFPDGQSKRIVISDLKFGAIPLNIGGRDTYGTMSLSYGAEDYDLI